MSKLKDQADRDAAIKERKRDVIVLAGAGTGKTSLLTKRFVELIAPEDDTLPGSPVGRLAAVTFTRKAAGELKNRIRTELLTLLETNLSQIRRKRISDALSDLDFSSIGTIHGFADRLLRLRPIEARISPSYQIVEDTESLIHETTHRWLEGARSSKLLDQWSNIKNAPSKDDCEAATVWLRDLLEAGIEIQDKEFEFSAQIGIVGLVRCIVDQRDRGNPVKVAIPYSPTTTDRELKQILSEVEKCVSTLTESDLDPGARHLKGLIDNLKFAIETNSLGKKINWLKWVFCDAKVDGKAMTMKNHFSISKENGTWELYNKLRGSGKDGGYWLSVFSPLVESLLAAAASAQPVIISLYEDVKKRHEMIDQLDLLIKLRDLLSGNATVKASFGKLFDHVFVDEFQDTDPIQAEVLFHLCESPGTLTIIGDPKQSIYRFRRADISIFANAVNQLKARNALTVRLSTNFRSRPALINAFNKVFPNYFGAPDPKSATPSEFDAETGWVSYSGLEPNPQAKDLNEPSLRFLRVNALDATTVSEQRPLEARLAARHIAWLLSQKNQETNRPIIGSDIAVLTRAMTNVPLLVRELRSLGVEVHITGGREYASSELIQRYILVLNSIANSSDGPGAVAARQFPFSSVTPFDEDTDLRTWLTSLRRERFNRPILHTALDVIEESLALRILGLGINADNDLAMLYRFANMFASTAAKNGWDFDETARWAREWLENPPQINSPATENKNAVRIMTIHQAKGLEFPIVYLLDGYERGGTDKGSGYRISADGKEWMLSIGGYDAVFNPSGRTPDFKAREASHIREEQKRLHYVAATRAEDLLIIPIPDPAPPTALYNKVWGTYLADEKSSKEGRHLTYPSTEAEGKAAHLVPYKPREEWLSPKVENVSISVPSINEIADKATPATRFTSVTSEAHRVPTATISSAISEAAADTSSTVVYLPSGGAALGTVVHRALQLFLNAHTTIEKAVQIAAHELGESIDRDLALAHVKNAINVLEKQGYLDGSWTVYSELPFIYSYTLTGQQTLVRGVIDLLLVKGDAAHIIDFKTDGAVLNTKTKTQYQEQLNLYAEAVKNYLPTVRHLKTALLMTASGESL